MANAHIIEFKNPDDLKIRYQTSKLNQLAFFADYSRQTDIAPVKFVESLEFFRRTPAFYAFNGNKASYTKKDKIK